MAEMSSLELNVTAVVRVARFASWVTEDAVSPLAITTVHSVPAGSDALAAVSVNVASDAAELDPAAAKVVPPQPSCPLAGDAARPKVGRVNVRTSSVNRGVFNAKAKDIDDST